MFCNWFLTRGGVVFNMRRVFKPIRTVIAPYLIAVTNSFGLSHHSLYVQDVMFSTVTNIQQLENIEHFNILLFWIELSILVIEQLKLYRWGEETFLDKYKNSLPKSENNREVMRPLDRSVLSVSVDWNFKSRKNTGQECPFTDRSDLLFSQKTEVSFL